MNSHLAVSLYVCECVCVMRKSPEIGNRWIGNITAKKTQGRGLWGDVAGNQWVLTEPENTLDNWDIKINTDSCPRFPTLRKTVIYLGQLIRPPHPHPYSLRWSFLYVPLLLTPKDSRLVKRLRARQQMLTFKWAHKPESRLTLQQSCPRTNLRASNTCLPCDEGRSLLRWESILSLAHYFGVTTTCHHTRCLKEIFTGQGWTRLKFPNEICTGERKTCFYYQSIIRVDL